MEKTLKTAGHKCRSLIHNAAGSPVVFLHGLSYTADVWQRIGVTDLLIEKHVPFLALDMPYGLKTNCEPKTRNPETNVQVLAEAVQSVFGSAVPLLVGASLGGYIALRYAQVSRERASFGFPRPRARGGFGSSLTASLGFP